MSASHPQTDFPGLLLDKAEQLCQSGFCEAALVTAQSACEICCEQVLSFMLKQRRIDYLQGALHDLLTNYNVANPKTRKLYCAVTGAAIERQPFWQAYHELVKHRNRVVHKGESVSSKEVEFYLKTAKGVIDYLKNVSMSAESTHSSTEICDLKDTVPPDTSFNASDD